VIKLEKSGDERPSRAYLCPDSSDPLGPATQIGGELVSLRRPIHTPRWLAIFVFVNLS